MKTLKDELFRWKETIQPQKQSSCVKRKSTELSKREIKELMGMNGPRYERRNGAIRQK